MQAVVPYPFWHKLNLALQRFGSEWRISGSLVELSIGPPCSFSSFCSSCGKCIPKMPASWNKTKLLGVMMMVNFLIYILIEVSRSYSNWEDTKPIIPPEKFWKNPENSDAYWNRKQQVLEYENNPLISSSTADATTVYHTEAMQTSTRLNSTAKRDHCEPNFTVTAQVKDFSSLPQRFKDFLLYMKCQSYPMLIDAPGVCSETPFLLLAVKSMTPHFDRRQAIRESWGRAGILSNRRVATVFLLGTTPQSDFFPNVSGMLHYEASLHDDLLQWDFRDTFFNLTLKEVLFLNWMAERCPSAQFIFKGDDDIFVNTRNILNFLDGLSDSKARDLFVGDVISGAGPHRDMKLKYYIPESFFVGGYPPYAGGGGFLFSSDVGIRLRNISQQVSLFPIDDVYTGMCLQKLGLVPEKHQGFRTFNIEEKYKESACMYQSLMLVHPRSPQEMIQIWSWISDPKLSCK
ncbi:N-acetyllactosaminide beta-1,3-N-acetylglucosaminyltransferase 2a isoform X2 [Tachysurus fulvidraco]|uniref:N-acetyllactosaminide beta-1,3-N-acetylglucosaminyltransferase 2a isoform X2 n=2 Tax=Tachysurus fulvidraco TaxID=1234273 RepID=UPI001FEF8582|nr:N-acetyllactosaminide beta-1,3-N-acetylglucosaminyltransferase 2a isoform X2 [Tachysurus fulvidraco]